MQNMLYTKYLVVILSAIQITINLNMNVQSVSLKFFTNKFDLMNYLGTYIYYFKLPNYNNITHISQFFQNER